MEIRDAHQRRILLIVLALNLALAAGFWATGLAASSSALIANGLDNASDSAVYIITLLALSRSAAWKRSAAKVSGWLLILFAAGILIDVGRRFFDDAEPIGTTMMVMALGAAIVNATCVWLLKTIQQANVNVRAVTTFSTNDLVANAGVLVGGGLVLWTGRAWPDLVVGLAVAAIALKGGIEILRDARGEENG
ncbi:RND transporter [Lysobacter concretionis Ko07 = DSM 16239]|uniref:RND transporter n=1 Tax=Lysobacter concretionis Ko07 = DSM 16239 TaxID=1122185 RepID=A0A0A0EIB1_9GAMM|nr:RND transporter [Lysobacter concretionis Ko07 = DSM 16239]